MSDYSKKWRAAHPDYQKEWKKDNADRLQTYKVKANIKSRERYRNDPIYREKLKEANHRLYLACRAHPSLREQFGDDHIGYRNELRRRQNARNRRLRDEIYAHYSKGDVKCACCGENDPRFLNVEHINGRASKTDIGVRLYYRLKRENFPEGYQILCYNCNIAKGIYGQCPHQEIKNDGKK